MGMLQVAAARQGNNFIGSSSRNVAALLSPLDAIKPFMVFQLVALHSTVLGNMVRAMSVIYVQ